MLLPTRRRRWLSQSSGKPGDERLDRVPIASPVGRSHCSPRSGRSTYTLRRLTSKDGDPLRHEERPNHASTCPFHVDKDTSPALVDRSTTFDRFENPIRSYIDALPAIPDRLADAADDDISVRRNGTTDRPDSVASCGGCSTTPGRTSSNRYRIIPILQRFETSFRDCAQQPGTFGS